MLSRTATSKLDNHKKCQQNQHIRMIANNEDLRNDAENSQKSIIYITLENISLKHTDITNPLLSIK